MSRADPTKSDDFLEVFHCHDWSKTPLGPLEHWDEEIRRWVQFILRAAQPMFIVWGTDPVILFNEAHSRTLGPDYRTILGLRVSEYWAPIWSEMKPLIDDVYAGNTAVIEDKPLPTWQSDFKEVRYFTASYCPLCSLEGQVLGGLCIVTDRTEVLKSKRSREEERSFLRELFEQAPGFIAVLEGPEHRYTVANAAYRHLLSAQDLLGKTVAQAFPEFVGQGLIEMLDRVWATREPFRAKSMPVHLATRDRPLYLDLICQPLEREGCVVGIVAEGHDVTAHQEAQEHVLSLQSDLIHMSRLGAMGNMAATLAHELNQPLTAISNYAAGLRGLLKRGGDLAQAELPVGEIENNAQRAGKIIRSLRSMTEGSGPRREIFNPERAIKEAVSFVRIGACSSIRIDCVFCDGVNVCADPIQIQQVIANLVKNACDALSGSDDPQVTVSTSIARGMVQVCVTDNGPGLSPDVQGRLFDAFTTTKADGMGMGLSISRTIIESHGGKIFGCSLPDRGSSFCFTLPIAEKRA